MSTHARLSPSTRSRWGVCPGSVRAIAAYPNTGRSSAAADDGTHTHTLLEHCLKDRIDPELTVGLIMHDHVGTFTVDHDRAARVRVAMDYITTQPGVILTEHHVNPSPLVGRDDMMGTVDVHIICGRHLEVIDYKDGMGEVSAEDNPQMEQYLFGLLAEHAEPDGSFPFDSFKLTIIQPKLALKGGNPVSSYDIGAEEIPERLIRLMQQANATDDPNAPFVPGEKQCNWCLHAGNCSSKINHALGKAGIQFDKIEVAQKVAQQDIEIVTDDQLRQIVEAAPMLRKLIESAEEEALKRIQSGKLLPGLKVVKGPGRRKWIMPEEDIATRLSRMGMPKGEIWKTVLVSPAQVEKVRWTKRDGSEKQLSTKQLEMIQTELVGKSEGSLTVVPEADKRESVKFTPVEEMFSAVTPDLPSWMS